MKNYCIFEVYSDYGGLFTTFAANFVSRGVKHSQSMIDTFCDSYQRHLLTDHRRDYKINFHVFFNTTNPAFMPNQLKVYRGKVSGYTSHQIARKDELLSFKSNCPCKIDQQKLCNDSDLSSAGKLLKA